MSAFANVPFLKVLCFPKKAKVYYIQTVLPLTFLEVKKSKFSSQFFPETFDPFNSLSAPLSQQKVKEEQGLGGDKKSGNLR